MARWRASKRLPAKTTLELAKCADVPYVLLATKKKLSYDVRPQFAGLYLVLPTVNGTYRYLIIC
jgi:hypothetical protein